MQRQDILNAFFNGESTSDSEMLSVFLDFREESITKFIREITDIIRGKGLAIGLDCFSPSLARMVGQNLPSLTPLADWTKIMVYRHAYGPATLPYELSHLVEWLISKSELSDSKIYKILSKSLSFQSLSTSLEKLPLEISSEILATEIERGIQSNSGKLLVGIESVEIPGVSEPNEEAIITDLVAIKDLEIAGLAISWDLWRIPLNWLELVSKIWL